ncbi:M23 family metallopeptidase [Paenibacillus sp. GCM10023252]|uniref:M23 family metallopeptidase n=1 Tax=Paenibacillus sp. GCM10023252 TaxID=3252649 RepID=UPI003608E99F
MKPCSTKFTFVIIPDGNTSIKRFRLSGLTLITIPALAVLLSISVFTAIYLYSNYAARLDHLKTQLNAAKANYNQAIKVKEASITKLEAELGSLSEQAEQMKVKMAELGQLELELKQLAGIRTTDTPNDLVTEAGGQGGVDLPLREEPHEPLIAGTKRDYESIGERMAEMKPSLLKTRSSLERYKKMQDITPTIWPADSRKVTSLFGIRKDPFNGKDTFHSGLDLGGSIGEPVYATADGVVSLSDEDDTHGNYIMINHGRGVRTRYLHLHTRAVEDGDKVKKGQPIGELGNTGRSTGPHLHYEVSVNGENVDPRPYIQANREEP